MHWPSVLAAFASLFALGLLDNARGPLFPDVLRGLTLSDTEGAWLFAASSAAGLAGSLLGRPLVRRVRVAHALRAGLLLVAGGVGLVGVSGSLAPLVAGSALFGLGLGLLSLVQSTLIQRGAPPALQRQAFAGLHSMYGLASLLAPLAVAAAARLGADWRATFRGLALVPLALAALSLLLREPPAARVATTGGPATFDRARALVVCLLAGLTVSAELGISTRLVLHLERLEYAPDAARLYLTAFFACLLTGRVTMSLVRTTRTHHQLLALSAAAALVLSTLGLLVHPAFLCLTALAMAPSFPVISALVADEFPAAFEQVMGILLATVCALVMATHWTLGWLSDAVSLHAALGLSPALLGVTLGLVAATRRDRGPSAL